MSYEALADLVELHKRTITERIAEQVHKRQLPSYLQLNSAQLASLLVPTVEIVGNYFHTSDPSQYRHDVRKLTVNRLEQGDTAHDIYTISQFLTEVVKDLVDSNFSGPELASIRDRYYRRLEGLQALAHNVVVATEMSFRFKRDEA